MNPLAITGVVIVMLGLALGWAVNEVREGDRALAKADLANSLTQQAAKLKDEKALEIAAIHEDHGGTITTLTKENQNVQAQLDLQMLTASIRAERDPLAFGDDFVRGLIRVDCLFALGKDSVHHERRDACRREAAMADPQRSGIPVTTITPDFLRGWAEACDTETGWGRVGGMIGADEFVEGETEDSGEIRYTRDMWEVEFPQFTPDMCREKLVAFTADASVYFEKFLNRAEGYTSRLTAFAIGQDAQIDVLSVPRSMEPLPD